MAYKAEAWGWGSHSYKVFRIVQKWERLPFDHSLSGYCTLAIIILTNFFPSQASFSTPLKKGLELGWSDLDCGSFCTQPGRLSMAGRQQLFSRAAHPRGPVPQRETVGLLSIETHRGLRMRNHSAVGMIPPQYPSPPGPNPALVPLIIASSLQSLIQP